MRIFLKLFLSFWLTVVAVAAAVAWIGYQYRGELEQAFHLRMSALFSARDALHATLAGAGAEAARRELAASPQREEIYIVDEAGRDLLGRPLPAGLEERLKERESWGGGHRPGGPPFPPPGPFPGAPEGHHGHAPVAAADGHTYRVEVSPPRPSLRRLLDDPLRPAVALGLSALLVLLPARHFSAPLRRLRRVTRQLAAGELSARIEPLHRFVPDELSELGNDFNRMAEQTERLVEAHKLLLRDVSHELRSPLARLRVALGLAERKSPAAAAEMARIEREVERLDELIGRILTLARLDAGEPVRRESWLDLATLLEAVTDDARFEATEAGKGLRLDRRGDALLLADAVPLRSALENVVRNALRHAPAGSAVEVVLERSDGEAVVTVADRGGGVPSGELERIFDPFVRIGEARDRDSGGYGLGLAIAARVVQAHGGAIAAANRDGGGLEVTIRLPVAEEEEAEE